VGPEVEAHLCQLAMMENYASHPMYVKFSDEEADALEQRSLQLALEDSKADEEAARCPPPPPNRSFPNGQAVAYGAGSGIIQGRSLQVTQSPGAEGTASPSILSS